MTIAWYFYAFKLLYSSGLFGLIKFDYALFKFYDLINGIANKKII